MNWEGPLLDHSCHYIIVTSKQPVKHPFASQNTQQVISMSYDTDLTKTMRGNVICTMIEGAQKRVLQMEPQKNYIAAMPLLLLTTPYVLP